MKNKVQRFVTNKEGRDFIVGDLHGCLEDLLLALKAITFDEQKDRLFSVGDLIDRGKHSLECVSLLDKSWFHCVKGNHEEMMVASILHANPHAAATWIGNGGNWSLSSDHEKLFDAAKRVDDLPLVIVVGEGEERFNVVHAELLKSNEKDHSGVSDKDIDEWTFSETEEYNMLWGRSLASYFPHYLTPEQYQKAQGDLSLTYVGHTPTNKLFKTCKQLFLDRGCVYHYASSKMNDLNALAIACHQDKVVYEWNPMWMRVVKIPYDQILTK